MSVRVKIEPPRGKLGVLIPGLGAVASTFIAGVALTRRGKALPVGSLTQLQRLRLGRRPDSREVLIKDLVPLAELEDLVFGGWDPVETNALEAARRAGALPRELIDAVQDDLRGVRAFPAAFRGDVVRGLTPQLTKRGTHRDVIAQLRADIRALRASSGATRLVMALLASPEAHGPSHRAHGALSDLEEALDRSDPALTPSLLYAYAGLQEGAPFVNGTPNVSSDARAIQELASLLHRPVAGKDLKTGQTLTNGDGRDSILAAPGVLDLVLLMDLAARAGLSGVQDWLSFFFKSPIGLRPQHDPSAQHLKLTNMLRTLAGEEPLHPTDLDDVDEPPGAEPGRKDAA